MNMYNWIDQQIADRNKKAMPLVSYPAVQFLFVTVKELVSDSRHMAMGMRLIADRYKMPFSTSYMDLSVEAEAFGSTAIYKPDAVPTIMGKIVETQEDADALKVPEVGAGRTGVCVDGIKKALMLIKDRPVFANCTGPFSMAGRMMDVNEILLMCIEEPEIVHTVLKKAAEFSIKYIKALKDAGAHGVIMAEPLAGLLSPGLMQEFSTDYVKQIVDEVQDKNFIVAYHNCANAIETKIDEVIGTGCRMFHFGDRADMVKMLESMPKDCIIMGNISPSAVFNCDSTRKVRLDTQRLLLQCMNYDNFIISSGCDVPADTDIDNIDKFFETVELGYYKRMLWDTIS
ncbi:MAG: uroporphyrinogen decarboxylase family protein [Oscillospiraceae bacterium]|nr:uroporphyrinogen decarboxylase family protein [Oscillospiraceae bacterium]